MGSADVLLQWGTDALPLGRRDTPLEFWCRLSVKRVDWLLTGRRHGKKRPTILSHPESSVHAGQSTAVVSKEAANICSPPPFPVSAKTTKTCNVVISPVDPGPQKQEQINGSICCQPVDRASKDVVLTPSVCSQHVELAPKQEFVTSNVGSLAAESFPEELPVGNQPSEKLEGLRDGFHGVDLAAPVTTAEEERDRSYLLRLGKAIENRTRHRVRKDARQRQYVKCDSPAPADAEAKSSNAYEFAAQARDDHVVPKDTPTKENYAEVYSELAQATPPSAKEDRVALSCQFSPCDQDGSGDAPVNFNAGDTDHAANAGKNAARLKALLHRHRGAAEVRRAKRRLVEKTQPSNAGRKRHEFLWQKVEAEAASREGSSFECTNNSALTSASCRCPASADIDAETTTTPADSVPSDAVPQCESDPAIADVDTDTEASITVGNRLNAFLGHDSDSEAQKNGAATFHTDMEVTQGIEPEAQGLPTVVGESPKLPTTYVELDCDSGSEVTVLTSTNAEGNLNTADEIPPSDHQYESCDDTGDCLMDARTDVVGDSMVDVDIAPELQGETFQISGGIAQDFLAPLEEEPAAACTQTPVYQGDSSALPIPESAVHEEIQLSDVPVPEGSDSFEACVGELQAAAKVKAAEFSPQVSPKRLLQENASSVRCGTQDESEQACDRSSGLAMASQDDCQHFVNGASDDHDDNSKPVLDSCAGLSKAALRLENATITSQYCPDNRVWRRSEANPLPARQRLRMFIEQAATNDDDAVADGHSNSVEVEPRNESLRELVAHIRQVPKIFPREPKEAEVAARVAETKREMPVEDRERAAAARLTLELMEARRITEATMDSEAAKKKNRPKRQTFVDKRCGVHYTIAKLDEEFATQLRERTRYLNGVPVQGEKPVVDPLVPEPGLLLA